MGGDPGQYLHWLVPRFDIPIANKFFQPRQLNEGGFFGHSAVKWDIRILFCDCVNLSLEI